MTSFRQIESNRRNALRSTGPKTESGRQRSSQNALRHGLTAETIITSLENADDYKAFELVVTSNYDAETAVERELVLRLASLLWRLRRATSIETGLFQIQSEPPRSPNQDCTLLPVLGLRPPATEITSTGAGIESAPTPKTPSIGIDIAQCFLRVADLQDGAFERLGRYEATLWRQVRQILFALERLQWRTSKNARYPGRHAWSAVPLDRDLTETR
jgi:hypothetical protein